MTVISSKPLKILNASAGSGKTFNLVKEYISLLLTSENDISKFTRIIAMTFTNKAALEMKSRIVKALDELSYPEYYKERSHAYAALLSSELSIPTHDIHIRSRKILHHILHRYEDFFVLTIDKFNLKLIRSFSRDLDLPNDFEVILNEKEVIEQVVDLLLDQLGDEQKNALTNLVFEYAKNNLDDGEKWNFRDQLIEFGTILSKEKDQQLILKLLAMDLSSQRYKTLKVQLKNERELFEQRCLGVYTIYLGLNIPSNQFPQGSKITGPIEKLASMKDIPEVLFTAFFIAITSQEPPKGKVYPHELREALFELHEYHAKRVSEYYTHKLFLKHFYNMALLQIMALSLDQIKKEEQLIRISEFNKLISDLVKNEDAPFIYERLGSRFQHFLLDEFQDTSRLQWLNMVPLIHESLGNSNQNLIVGDPKQSIYRFKNGVAEQFVALPEIYNPEQDASIAEKSLYFSKMGAVEQLEENWRSGAQIVEFNNLFFSILKEKLDPSSHEFYHSIHQQAKASLNGYVSIVSESETDEKTDIVAEIITRIAACEADGFKRGDICILSDVNVRANTWAVELTKLGYKVVSTESLLVQNELKVKLIVSYLKRRLNPSGDSEIKRFSELFFRIQHTDTFEQYRTYFEKHTTKEGKEYSIFNDKRFLQDYFGGSDAFFFKYENLYDLIQSFYKLMQWDELKNPYLHHFADFAYEFELAKGPDISSFLSHYADQKSKLAIQLPESDDAIKIMTIHKSKGLEFPVVIIPYIDFSVDIRATSKYLLETNDVILYTTLKKESPVDAISTYREHEVNQIITDKVNQCYVGFTRPVERLYVMNYFGKGGFGAMAHSCFNELSGSADSSIHLQFGEQTNRKTKHESNESVFFEPVNITEHLWFPDISLQDKADLLENDLLSPEQRFGNQFHLVIASLNHPNELDDTIQKFITTGEVESVFEERIRKTVERVFQLAEFGSFFENCTEILNERSIILDVQTTMRPDKVFLKENETLVLDFKTGIPKSNDVKQVQSYVNTLKNMEFPQVKGYILYTSLNELRMV
jgi:ATP-dependent exoDNAse (exonuclease V) beta subunit